MFWKFSMKSINYRDPSNNLSFENIPISQAIYLDNLWVFFIVPCKFKNWLKCWSYGRLNEIFYFFKSSDFSSQYGCQISTSHSTGVWLAWVLWVPRHRSGELSYIFPILPPVIWRFFPLFFMIIRFPMLSFAIRISK